ncbi:hypothetical protein MKY34_19790 [Sporosarcina sp. FSL K6-1522]|uniref:hypothetical protein n=1 Tax=Sporosarcina sp. FSL K6-1522 TaxID=2921554 RepID=UPI003159BC9C
MLATLTKKDSRQQLYSYGHYTRRELKQMQSDGWRIERVDKPFVQRNKHGIAVGRAI